MSPTPHPLARPLGYALVLTALVGLVFAAVFLVREATRSPRLIRVRFPEIATLNPGDPVVQGGVQVGAVESIRLENTSGVDSSASGLMPNGTMGSATEAIVTIELVHHRPLARDARFLNFSHSLMGARKVWIVPGNSPLPLDESGVQQGFFAPGLAETLHKVDALASVLTRLRDETERLLTEDDPRRSPVAASVFMEGRLDTAARQLDRIAGRLESARAALLSGLRNLTSTTDQTRRQVRAAEPPTRAALLRTRDLLNAVESVQQNLDTLLARLEKAAALAGDSTATGRLLNDDAAYATLEKSVRLLEKTARLMEKDGLSDSLKIRPRFR